MKLSLLVTAAVAMLAASPAHAQATNGQAASADAKFVDNVTRNGQAEIDLAQFASRKHRAPR